MEFTTKDQDNDAHEAANCAVSYGGGGGWWHRRCLRASFNGIYNPTPTNTYTGIVWKQWKTDFTCLKETWLMIRPRSFNEN